FKWFSVKSYHTNCLWECTMNYKTLLFDIDDTLLDFKAAEKFAISLLMEEMDLEASMENIMNYSSISQGYWEQFEKGMIEKDKLLARRFEDFFALHGLKVDGREMDQRFRQNLERGHFLIDGSIDLLESLKQTHELYAVTNGV